MFRFGAGWNSISIYMSLQNMNIKFKCCLKYSLSNTVIISIVNILCILNDLASPGTSVSRMQ